MRLKIKSTLFIGHLDEQYLPFEEDEDNAICIHYVNLHGNIHANGMHNPDMTSCYANSTLQAFLRLLSPLVLTDYMFRSCCHGNADCDHIGVSICQLAQCIAKFVRGSPSVGTDMRRILGGRFNQDRQQDAHEFLLKLLNVKCQNQSLSSLVTFELQSFKHCIQCNIYFPGGPNTLDNIKSISMTPGITVNRSLIEQSTGRCFNAVQKLTLYLNIL